MPIRFLPTPRELHTPGGCFDLPQTALIVTPGPALLFEAQTAQQALSQFAGLDWPIVAGNNYANTGLTLEIEEAIAQPGGYQLTINDQQIRIRGADAAGVYYSVCTLRQILQQYPASLPQMRINDWPDFAARGIMLDVSRDKVPTMDTLYDLIDRLAHLKINQVQLYMEHTFAYCNHPEVWAQASPFTGQEIMALDAFCRQRHVELVPNQNSLGHMERWLKLERYRPLAESPNGFTTPWGQPSGPTSLNPIDPGSVALMASLYDELLPHFTSHKFNIGGDEPWELGTGQSKAERDRIGEGRLYVDYILKIYEEVSKRGKQMMMWDDIIVKYPELVPELPYDLIAMVWGYEADHPFAERCGLFLGANIPFYVCPGTSSWNTFAGRTDNAIGNLHSAALNGHNAGALGYLITDWGDGGHWQPNAVSYLGFAYGAALSWYVAGNNAEALPALLDTFVFEDRAGVMGQLAYDLGNVYRTAGHARPNGHQLIDLLRMDLWRETLDEPMPDADSLRQAIVQTDQIISALGQADMQRPDAAQIVAEYQLAADLLRHSARHGLFLLGDATAGTAAELKAQLKALVERHQQVWLARNRPGGLSDSVARFDKALDAYTQN